MKLRIKLATILLLLSFQAHAVGWAETNVGITAAGWSIIESRYCTILCAPGVDIGKVEKNIKIRFKDSMLDEEYYSSKGEKAEDRLARKIDYIYQRTEKILDMHPRNMHLTVQVYANQDQLDVSYFEVLRHKNVEQKSSYYLHERSTIYTTERFISQRLIAYEMTHAISDHHFSVPSPMAVKEVLAKYVEDNLED